MSAIGVFDSGVGGLSVLHEVRCKLPAETLLYVADSGFGPYGERPDSYIERRANVVADFLVEQGAKALVIACNTATAVAVRVLRQRLAIPVVAIEPAVKPAVASSRSGIVGVLATQQTLASASFSRLVVSHAKGAQILSEPCSGLVGLVEAGDVSSLMARAMVSRHVRALCDRGADTIVLGCTHLRFLDALIQEEAGPMIRVIDPGQAVATELHRQLRSAGLLAAESCKPIEQFWTSGTIEHARSSIAALWARPVHVKRLPDEYCSESAT